MTGDHASAIDLYLTRVTQPIGEFFIGKIPALQLVRLARTDVRRISNQELEWYTGIQRQRNENRVRQIEKFIKSPDACFPNSIILNLNPERILQSNSIVYNSKSGNEIQHIVVEDKEDTFQIIDGQHRLSGFENINSIEFEILISVFIDLFIDDQAYLFSTINLTQAKVSKSLAYDLFSLSRFRSPQKVLHEMARAVNIDESSPFFRRIKILGVNPRFGEDVLYRAPLSQAAFIERLIPLLTTNAASDRNIERAGGRPSLDQNCDRNTILRKFYVEREDSIILRIVMNYFSAIQIAFPDDWEDISTPLPRTIGYGALTRLLIDLGRVGLERNNLSKEFFLNWFQDASIRVKDAQFVFNFDVFPASGAGETKLYRFLKSITLDKNSIEDALSEI